MPKGIPNTAEFKQTIIEIICKEGLNYREAARQLEMGEDNGWLTSQIQSV